MTDLEDAAGAAVGHVPAVVLTALADAIADGGSVSVPWAGPGADRMAAVIAAAAHYPAGPAAASAYLRGLAAGYTRRATEQRVEPVWGGPAVHDVPTRSMGQVIAELIGRATHSLLLMTYSAKPYPPVIAELGRALDRQVSVSIVVETLAGAGSAISGDEPATAFIGLPGIDLWHWPKAQRAHEKAKMHAKIAVGDERELLVSSANLTASGIDQSMEAALLITGGAAPRRAKQHVEGLISRGLIRRLT